MIDPQLAPDQELPVAFCELCDKQYRASSECLNCNVPMCSSCKENHLKNERMSKHVIKDYSDMLLRLPPKPEVEGKSGALIKDLERKFKSDIRPPSSTNSANSKRSVRSMMFERKKDKFQLQEELQLMQCANHPTVTLTYYSVHMRELVCSLCISENRGQIYFQQAKPIDNAIKQLQQAVQI